MEEKLQLWHLKNDFENWKWENLEGRKGVVFYVKDWKGFLIPYYGIKNIAKCNADSRAWADFVECLKQRRTDKSLGTFKLNSVYRSHPLNRVKRQYLGSLTVESRTFTHTFRILIRKHGHLYLVDRKAMTLKFHLVSSHSEELKSNGLLNSWPS
jgi:hypothetical protein